MEVTWYGMSCFRISERGRITVITDPYAPEIGLVLPKLKADVVTISHDAPGHAYVDGVKGATRILRGAGEYEIAGVFVTGIALNDADGTRSNIGYHIAYDQVTVLHLGDLSQVPSQSVIQELGQVSILLLPVGGGSLKAAAAAEIVAQIEPSFVVPMHYHLEGLTVPLEPLDKFLSAMGVSKATPIDQLKISAADAPDQPQVVVLEPKHSES